jgi:hypothetical protein
MEKNNGKEEKEFRSPEKFIITIVMHCVSAHIDPLRNGIKNH